MKNKKYILMFLLFLCFPALVGFNGYYRTRFFGGSPFSGTLTQLNTDTEFEYLTSGTAYPISEITNANPPVITFAGDGVELVATSDDRDFTTWGNVNWVGYSGGTVADGTGKLICTMDASGDSGTYLPSNNINTTDGNEQWFEISLDVWQGTTAKTNFNVSFGDPTNYKTITVSGVQDTYIVRIQSNIDEPHLRIVAPNSDSGTFFVDNASVQKLHDYSEGDCITIGGVSESEGVGSELVTNGDFSQGTNGVLPTGWLTGSGGVGFTKTAGERADCTDLSTNTLDTYQKIASEYNDFIIFSFNYYNIVDVKYGIQGRTAGGSYVKYVKSGTLLSGSGTVSFKYSISNPQIESLWVFFNSSDGTSSGEVDNISVKKIHPVQAIPNRITSIDSEGKCTLGNLDLSSMAAAITSAYASKTDFEYYTAGDGWKPYTEVDYTPVNSNSEFDQWTYTSKTSGSTVAGLMYRIDAQSIVDFTTVGSADNVVGTEFLCTGVVALSAVDAVSEITPTEYTVLGLSATNYLVYDTSANTIRFVSDGNSLTLRSTAIANETFFYDVSITDMTDVGIYISAYGESIAKVFDTKNTYLGFLTTGDDERIQLVRSTDCDVTVSYWRMYEVTDTGAECDGEQTTTSDLESTEAAITRNKGIKTTIDLDSINSGSITPVISTNEGTALSSPTITPDEQNIKANGTDAAKIRASTAASGVVVKEFIIEQYR